MRQSKPPCVLAVRGPGDRGRRSVEQVLGLPGRRGASTSRHPARAQRSQRTIRPGECPLDDPARERKSPQAAALVAEAGDPGRL